MTIVSDDDFEKEYWGIFTNIVFEPLKEVYHPTKGIDRKDGKDIGGIGIAFNVKDPYAVHYATLRAAKFIPGLDQDERDRLKNLIIKYVDEGRGPQGLCKAIMKDFGFSRERSQWIAWTETAIIFNASGIESLKKSMTPTVKCLDGASSDPDEAGEVCKVCMAVNGMVISIETAERHLIQHPICIRSFSPVVTRPNETIKIQDAEFENAIRLK
jgi:hypothetical protein